MKKVYLIRNIGKLLSSAVVIAQATKSQIFCALEIFESETPNTKYDLCLLTHAVAPSRKTPLDDRVEDCT